MGDMSREPSMEEILSSIRRVIARDEAQISGGQMPVVAVVETADDDVLDLTDTAAPLSVDDAPPALAGAIAAADDSSAGTVSNADAVDPILSPAPQAAARQQLDSLAAALVAAQHSEPRVADQVTTVNALVEAALRPMLRDWLDSNLPDVVERMVAREIARITGNGG